MIGGLIAKLLKRNPCTSDEDTPVIPRFHFKCRFHPDDRMCPTDIYTRTKDVIRYHVPRERIKWEVDYPNYTPREFTSEKILLKDGQIYKDPNVTDNEYYQISFNAIDNKYECDRKSHHGTYKFIQLMPDKNISVPRNPVGRTGLTGRGHLGRWGPNHAADPIVTAWKRDQNGRIVKDPDTEKPILKFISIQRRDTKEWAIPGGMRDPNELVTKTLTREFAEEALSHQLVYDTSDRIEAKAGKLEERLALFFKGGIEIYKGYVDDPRNTDNAWMETMACNFHDATGEQVDSLPLRGGDDADHAVWMDLSSKLKLFASHVDFLQEVATIHKAHW